MPKFWRGVVRLLAAGAVVALAQPLYVTLADATKDLPLCIQGCQDTFLVCSANCDSDCTALFPLPSQLAQRTACIDACVVICEEIKKDCKERCRKGGGTPTEP